MFCARKSEHFLLQLKEQVLTTRRLRIVVELCLLVECTFRVHNALRVRPIHEYAEHDFQYPGGPQDL
jgi:hypothetical protein